MKSFLQFVAENEKRINGQVDRQVLPQIHPRDHEAFKQFLTAKGIGLTEKKMPVKDLKPMQNNLNMDKVEKLKKCLKDSNGKCLKGKMAFFTSHDHCTLDGHHRSAALEAHDPNTHIHATVADASAPELIALGHEFNHSISTTANAGMPPSPTSFNA